MEIKLILDNWTLQDVNQALELGLDFDKTGEIVIDIPHDSHTFTQIPHAVIQIDALLLFIVNVVLRDRLFVDDRFSYVWDSGNKHLRELRDKQILIPFDFLSAEEKISGIREHIVNELCVTRSIRAIQIANERLWKKQHESFDAHMSQLVWGAAGYLARSHVYESPYSGCPYRQALIRQTAFFNQGNDAVSHMEKIIVTKRASVFQRSSPGRNAKYVKLNLPLITADVINEARDISQLLPVAIQMREKYKKLREWLGEYQTALDNDDPKNMLKHVKVLESVARDIDSEYSFNKDDSLNLSISALWFSANLPVSKIVNQVRDKFGVRALLNDLVFSKYAHKSLKKLVKFFIQGNSKLSEVVYKQLIDRYTISQ